MVPGKHVVIRLAAPAVSEAGIARCNEVLRSGNLVQGAQVSAFEQALSDYTGIGECAVVSSGTAALHLALRAVGVRAGDAVLVPDFTFAATGNAVENLGAHCIFCDVEPGSYVLTAANVAACLDANIGEPVRAIVVVHEFGYPADISAISELAKSRGIRMVEDAACALGTVASGRHVGYYSDAACFSFHPRKAITTGEGGAVISRDQGLVESVRRLRNHGIERTDNGIEFTDAGLNYRMTDFQAALAFDQLEKYPAEIRRRQQLAAGYHDRLGDVDGVSLPVADEGHTWQSYMVVLDENMNRDDVIHRMRERGIEANLGAQALHRLDWFAKTYGHTTGAFPVASHLYDSGLVLPLYGSLQDEEVAHVAQALADVLGS